MVISRDKQKSLVTNFTSLVCSKCLGVSDLRYCGVWVIEETIGTNQLCALREGKEPQQCAKNNTD